MSNSPIPIKEFRLDLSELMATVGKTLQLVTSVTFAGSDLRTVYVGSLGMNRLPTFRSPVPGLPMRHWK